MLGDELSVQSFPLERFLTIDILGWIIVCCGGYPDPYMMFSTSLVSIHRCL